jgi:protein-S-isoprenylcysteine O-methyltransferase Ste14
MQARFGWVLMEFPAFFMILLFYILAGGFRFVVPTVFLLLWELHYVQRTFVYPSIMANGKKKNFPFAVAMMGFAFNLLNGGVNGWYLYITGSSYPVSWLWDIRFIIGTALFLAGYGINIYADRELRRLRLKNTKEYSIPKGGLFELISSPNYFGEMLEWAGWAVLTWSLPGLAFAIFTFANLFPRAVANHKWYRKTFKNYPKERKAIIPFVL